MAGAVVCLAGWRASREHSQFAGVPVNEPARLETAVFSGGCFWGLQAAFDKLPGVFSTRAGYTGGAAKNPTYERVVSGGTGHAEAVEVMFDPEQVSYEQLVRYFFQHHRPWSDEPEASYRTRAYRSAIFVAHRGQREIAERIRRELALEDSHPRPAATLIEEAGPFWEAEAYHQKYLSNCPQ